MTPVMKYSLPSAESAVKEAESAMAEEKIKATHVALSFS